MIHVIVGLMNSGKTLYMTYRLFIAHLKGKTVYSNYDLNFPHIKMKKEDLKGFIQKNKSLKNCALGFDELWIWLDARAAQKNMFSTYFFLQSSKDDAEIYITAQTNQQNDKRIRENLHKISECSRALRTSKGFAPITDDIRILPKEIQHKLYIRVKQFDRKNLGFGFADLVPTNTFYIRANNIFQLYDTRQKIKR